MPVVDARFRVHHPCPYCAVSEKFPRSLILLWCDNHRDIFLVSAPDRGELRRLLEVLRGTFRARPLLQDGTNALVVLREFQWSEPPSVTGLARRAKVWVLPPVVYFDGTETYRVVAGARSELRRFIGRVRRLGDVEILSVSGRAELATIRDLPTASVHFFEGLTDRQARCLVAAFEGGLLDVPARAPWEEVARRERLSRSTFGEHLRKGQYRLLANSYASLKERTWASEARVLLPGLPAPSRRRRSGAPRELPNLR